VSDVGVAAEAPAAGIGWGLAGAAADPAGASLEEGRAGEGTALSGAVGRLPLQDAVLAASAKSTAAYGLQRCAARRSALRSTGSERDGDARLGRDVGDGADPCRVEGRGKEAPDMHADDGRLVPGKGTVNRGAGVAWGGDVDARSPPEPQVVRVAPPMLIVPSIVIIATLLHDGALAFAGLGGGPASRERSERPANRTRSSPASVIASSRHPRQVPLSAQFQLIVAETGSSTFSPGGGSVTAASQGVPSMNLEYSLLAEP
jgi:hypothetical protein